MIQRHGTARGGAERRSGTADGAGSYNERKKENKKARK